MLGPNFFSFLSYFSVLLPIVLGITVGFVLALTGAGGGIIAVPLLVFFLNLTIQQAAPTGLVAIGLAAGVGAILAHREGLLRYRAAGLIGIFGVLTAPLGVFLAHQLPSTPLTLAFSCVLIWIAWRIFHPKNNASREVGNFQTSSNTSCRINPETGRFLWNKACASVLAITGIISGFASGMLGVGGGFIIVPTLTHYSNIKTQGAIATSLGVIGLVALSGITAAAMHGSIDWEITLPFAGGALAGMIAGNKVTTRIAHQHLQQGFAAVCLVAATLLISRTL